MFLQKWYIAAGAAEPKGFDAAAGVPNPKAGATAAGDLAPKVRGAAAGVEAPPNVNIVVRDSSQKLCSPQRNSKSFVRGARRTLLGATLCQILAACSGHWLPLGLLCMVLALRLPGAQIGLPRVIGCYFLLYRSHVACGM
jgi:hypothetical protein